jgi:hypothetical protein
VFSISDISIMFTFIIGNGSEYTGRMNQCLKRLLICVFILFTSCTGQEPATSKAPWTGVNCTNITSENADDCIRMNQIQVLGTYNSYKLAPLPELIEIGNNAIPGWAQDIDYGHRPLDYQLTELNVRQLKLDIYADPKGGLYAEPSGALLIGDEDFIGQG